MNKTTMAFAVNENGISVPLEQASSLRVYDLQFGKWTVSSEWNIRELSITISESISDAVRAIAALMQDCFTLVAGEFADPIRLELERLGIDVWELRGEPLELADVIHDDELRLVA